MKTLQPVVLASWKKFNVCFIALLLLCAQKQLINAHFNLSKSRCFVGLTMQNLDKLEIVLGTGEDSLVSLFRFIVQLC